MSKDTADKTIVMFYAQTFYKMRNMTLEQAGMFHMACLAHAVGEPYEVNDPFVNYCLEEFKDAFAKQQETRQAFIEKQRLNGTKGGRPRKNPNDKNETQNNPSLNLGYENETQNNPTVNFENPSITQKTLITSNESQVINLNNGDAKASLVDAEGDDDSDPPDLPSEKSPLDDLPDPDPEPEVKQKHKSKIPDPPYEVILALYKEILPELSQPSVLNAQRKGAINARWRELYSIAKTPEERLTCFRKVFENAKLNDWNFGNNERGWKANFDYFMQPKAFNQYLDCQAQPSGASNMSSIQKPWLVSGSALPTSYAQYKDWIAEGWNPATLNSSQFDKLQESGIIPSDGSFNKQNRRRA